MTILASKSQLSNQHSSTHFWERGLISSIFVIKTHRDTHFYGQIVSFQTFFSEIRVLFDDCSNLTNTLKWNWWNSSFFDEDQAFSMEKSLEIHQNWLNLMVSGWNLNATYSI